MSPEKRDWNLEKHSVSSCLILSFSPSLLTVWGKYIPEGSQGNILTHILRPINCSVPRTSLPSQQQYDSSVTEHPPPTQSADSSLYHTTPPTWSCKACSAQKDLKGTEQGLKPSNWFNTECLLATHRCLCFWSLSLITSDQRFSGLAGSSANTESARGRRGKKKILKLF